MNLRNMPETCGLHKHSLPCFILPSSTIKVGISKNSVTQAAFQLEAAWWDSGHWDGKGRLLVPHAFFLPKGSGNATVITKGDRTESQEAGSLKVSWATVLAVDCLLWDFLWCDMKEAHPCLNHHWLGFPLLLVVCIFLAVRITKWLKNNFIWQEAWQWASPVVIVVKNPPANAGEMRCVFDPWVRKIPWRGAWQPTPVFLPGESHGQRSLADYSPLSSKKLDVTEVI